MFLKLFFRGYMILVAMFFITNVLNNYAFDLNIAMPLHMIFRAVCLYLKNLFIFFKMYG